MQTVLVKFHHAGKLVNILISHSLIKLRDSSASAKGKTERVPLICGSVSDQGIGKVSSN